MDEATMKNERDTKVYLQAEKAMKADEDVISELIAYPPFSEIDDGQGSLDHDGVNPIWGYPGLSDRGLQLREAMHDAIKSMNDETKGVDYYDVDPEVLKKSLKGVMAEFSDDLDEARLYQKRYPDSVEALKASKTK
jgi:hypothetical protein